MTEKQLAELIQECIYDPKLPLRSQEMGAFIAKRVVESGLASAATQTAEQAQQAVVDDFIADREGFVTALKNSIECYTDYFRWQGHAEARRHLAERLAATGSPVTETTKQEEPAEKCECLTCVSKDWGERDAGWSSA